MKLFKPNIVYIEQGCTHTHIYNCTCTICHVVSYSNCMHIHVVYIGIEYTHYTYTSEATYLIHVSIPLQPLYVPMSDGVLQRLLETLDVEDNEIKLKSIFVEARDVVANQIADDLTQFRHKRTLGLGSMYGEQKLTGTHVGLYMYMCYRLH